MFNASLVKSIHLLPQTATFTTFNSPILVNWYNNKLGFKPEKDENSAILFLN